MNRKCHSRSVCDTFSARSAGSTGLFSVLITRAVVFLRSFDHLVGAQQERFWNRETKHLGGRKIQDEIEFGRLLDRKVGRLGTAENLIHELGGAPVLVSEAWSIGHQPSRYDVMPKNGDGRQLRAERQRIDTNLVGDQERVATNIQ